MAQELFLGLDLSTQSLTALVVSIEAGIVHQEALNFDQTYPHYGTRGGVLPAADSQRAHVDPMMWLEALEDMLGRLKRLGLTRRIAAMAISAQQHGTVYLGRRAAAGLSGLDPTVGLAHGLAGIFARRTCPVWMDSSSGCECREITHALGGHAAVAGLTGSVATERFAGPQIRKFCKEDPDAYARTTHIALISSFVTSVLAGRLAPVDAGDGYGTNLADIRRGDWSAQALAATAPALRPRLPRLVAGDEVIGAVSAYLSDRFGFRPETRVVVGSGDNPSSLVGLGLIGDPDRHAVSLGTSDTYFGYLPGLPDAVRTEGHIFGAADGRAMFLICFKNGSLARERVKSDFGLSWGQFTQLLLNTPAGNRGRIMLPYFMPEITPLILDAGVRRFGGLAADDAAGNVRAVVEAQAMALYLHAGWVGNRPGRLIATAGGSQNEGLLRVIAEVFDAEVQTLEVKESAALGAALRAAHAWLAAHGTGVGWGELFRAVVKPGAGRTIRPASGASLPYHAPGGLLSLYAACERHAAGAGPAPTEALAAFRGRFPERQ
ncbi:MAG: FGGY family carbohydrate kinase [Desulfobacterales bacterium]|jgi:xylulokinase|nr:FGGY family carbohydrate kinase [Desulfobacterales bacterium]